MGKAGTIAVVIALTLFAVPSFIVPTVYFTHDHRVEKGNTSSFDALVLCISIIAGLIPLFTALGLYVVRGGAKGKDGIATTIRYVLSKLKVPGFWSASVRNGKHMVCGEKMRDVSAVTVFVGIFVFLIVLFYALVGVMVHDSHSNIHHKSVHLLNGTTLVDPEVEPSREGTRVRVYADSGEYGVTNDTSLYSGSSYIFHGDTIPPSKLSFAYTINPGSFFTLTVNASKEVCLSYKLDDTDIYKGELGKTFDIAYNATNVTSFIINFTVSYGADPIKGDYRFELHPTYYSGYEFHRFNEQASAYVKRGEYLVVTRYSQNVMMNEYIDVDIQTADMLADTMFEYEWDMYSCVLYLCPLLMILLVLSSVSLIGCRSGEFTESLPEARKNPCILLGCLHMGLVPVMFMILFMVGLISASDEIEVMMNNNSVLNSTITSYSGRQFIIPLNDTQNPGVSYTTSSSNVMISAVKEVPSLYSNVSIDCNPGTVMSFSAYVNDFFISEGYSLEWDFESVDSVDLQLLNVETLFVYKEDNIVSSKHEVTVNKTGVYSLSIRRHGSSGSVCLTFHSLVLKTPKYDFSNNAVWSKKSSFSMEKLDDSVKFLVIEPVKSNITSEEVSVSVFKFDDRMDSVIKAEGVTLALLVISAVVFFIVDIIVSLDLGRLNLPCYCFRSNPGEAEIDTAGGDDETSSLIKGSKTETPGGGAIMDQAPAYNAA